MTETRSVSSQTIFPWIQALRAAAALAIAFYHVGHDAITNGADPRGWIAAFYAFMPWQAGVDVFFVISGFVIIHASAQLFGHPAGPGMFLRRRLTRIVPLYWIMTTVFLAVLLLSPDNIHGDIGGPFYLLASYLFIPMARPDGLVQPAFGLGWTLNYEMFFYLLLTLLLRLPRRHAVALACALLCLLVAAGRVRHFHNVPLAFWSNPIILEFAAGMVLAQALAQASAAGFRLAIPVRCCLIALALVELHICRHAASGWRPVAFGIPGLIFAACACLGGAPHRPGTVHKLMIFFGNASYALYLVHPFVMRGLSILWHRFHAANETAGLIYVLAGLVMAQACAVVLHVYVERNLYRMLRRRVGVTKNEAV